MAKSATPADILAAETPQQQMENHPVIRTLYDHGAVSRMISPMETERKYSMQNTTVTVYYTVLLQSQMKSNRVLTEILN